MAYSELRPASIPKLMPSQTKANALSNLDKSGITKTVNELDELTHKISLNDINMTDYGSIFDAGRDSQSNKAKQQIKAIWDREFTAPTLSTIPVSPSTKLSKLNICIIGAGVAGSTSESALSKYGHSIFTLEQRPELPSRANLVTINSASRAVLNKCIPAHLQPVLFQTNGKGASSERASIATIQNTLQSTTGSAPNTELKRGCTIDSIKPQTVPPKNQRALQAKISYSHNNTQATLDNIDLVIMATGARSAAPFGRKAKQSPLIKEHFNIQEIEENASALCFLKYRFPVKSTKEIPQHREINRQRLTLRGEKDMASFVNLYTGRKVEEKGKLYFETSLLFDCPVQWEKPEGQQALQAHLKQLAKQFKSDIDPQVKQLGCAMEEGKTSQIQQGVALVSHWITEKAYSDHLTMVGLGDAMCPPNPWTGSGSNLAIQSVEPLERLAHNLSYIRANFTDQSQVRALTQNALTVFQMEVKPLHMQALLRGIFASTIFERIHNR